MALLGMSQRSAFFRLYLIGVILATSVVIGSPLVARQRREICKLFYFRHKIPYAKFEVQNSRAGYPVRSTPVSVCVCEGEGPSLVCACIL